MESIVSPMSTLNRVCEIRSRNIFTQLSGHSIHVYMYLTIEWQRETIIMAAIVRK